MRLFLICGLLLAIWGSSAAQAAGTSEAVRRCQDVLPGFIKSPKAITITVQSGALDEPTGVRIDYLSMEPASEPDGFILCWFLGRASEEAAWQMDQLESSKFGVFRRYEIQQLYKLLHLETLHPTPLQVEKTLEAQALYFLQQLINALSLGCIYAVLAVGFTMIFSITRAVIFAIGEFYMLGAFTLYIGHVVAFWAWGDTLPSTLLLLLAFAVFCGAGWGFFAHQMVFRRIPVGRSTAALIAAIGLSIALKELVRLLQGAKTRYALVEELQSWRLIEGGGFDVYVSKGHLAVGLLTALMTVLLWWLSQRTSFGRQQRAVAQDPLAAQLLGVRVERVTAVTFMIGGALALAGGFFAGAQYGVINFHMGTIVGFKALTAALLGGIGSLPGALLGAFLLAFVENGTAVFLGAGWEDVVVFSVLVLVLVFRPQGLLGVPPQGPAGDQR